MRRRLVMMPTRDIVILCPIGTLETTKEGDPWGPHYRKGALYEESKGVGQVIILHPVGTHETT